MVNVNVYSNNRFLRLNYMKEDSQGFIKVILVIFYKCKLVGKTRQLATICEKLRNRRKYLTKTNTF